MTSYVHVNFQRIGRSPSIESAIHRWVARFEAMRFEVQRAAATVEPEGRNRTTVHITLALASGTWRTATATHIDPYVAVSDTFRLVRRMLLAAAPASLDRAPPAPGQLVA